MIDRLSVLCFAGTYGLALLAEAARFLVRRSGAVVSDGWLDGAGLAGSDGFPRQSCTQESVDPGDHAV